MLFFSKETPGRPLFCKKKNNQYEDLLIGFSVGNVGTSNIIFLSIPHQNKWILDVLDEKLKTEWIFLRNENHVDSDSVRESSSGSVFIKHLYRFLPLLVFILNEISE